MIRPHIINMAEYKPPLEGRSSRDALLLDFNERTTPVSRKIKDVLKQYLDSDCLQHYPEYGNLVQRLARYAGVSESEAMITNGSDHGIDLVFRAVSEPGDEAIVPVPTFAMLTHSAKLNDLKLHTPAYSYDQGYPFDQVLSLISDRTRVIVVCNPNNPTGTFLTEEKVLQLAKSAAHSAILVDECYYEYTKKSIKDHISECPNLLITRSLSKTWGLPSLRLGYLLSAEENIKHLVKVRGPYAVNRLAAVAATAALEDPSYMEEYVDEVLTVSKPMFLSYLEQKGLRYWPTEANFVLVHPPRGLSLVDELLKRGILVRPRSGPNIEATVRFTIGTRVDMEKLISSLEDIL